MNRMSQRGIQRGSLLPKGVCEREGKTILFVFVFCFVFELGEKGGVEVCRWGGKGWS